MKPTTNSEEILWNVIKTIKLSYTLCSLLSITYFTAMCMYMACMCRSLQSEGQLRVDYSDSIKLIEELIYNGRFAVD